MTEIRSIQITEVEPEDRTFTGIFAPYNEVIEHNGAKERYEAGLFADAEPVEIYFNHGKSPLGGDMPIGEVLSYEDTDAGNSITARFYDSARGNEAYALTKSGALNSLSAGFIATEERDEDGVRVLAKAYLDEVSLVKKPAYPSARISEVRSEETTNNKEEVVSEDTPKNMTEVNYDDSEIRSGLADLERRFEVLNSKEEVSTAPEFRSAGEWLKGLASNDENAKTEVRAYTGATLSDSHTSNDWKADALNIVDKGRPVVNLFETGPLGNHGNSVEYPKISNTTGDVAKQVAEGDNLAYLEVSVTTATAPVVRYGGYSELSAQAIERSDVSYLDAVLKYQAASYAKVTNAAVVAAVNAANPQTGTSFTLSSATGASFIGAAVDGIQKIEDNGRGATPDFVLVSADVWAKLATLVDGNNRPLFAINGDGSNTLGSVNVRGIAGSLAGMPVVVSGSFAAKTLYVASASAVCTWENSGAPIRLQDENIINLTKQFSLYGDLAVGVKNELGLVKATIA